MTDERELQSIDRALERANGERDAWGRPVPPPAWVTATAEADRFNREQAAAAAERVAARLERQADGSERLSDLATEMEQAEPLSASEVASISAHERKRLRAEVLGLAHEGEVAAVIGASPSQVRDGYEAARPDGSARHSPSEEGLSALMHGTAYRRLLAVARRRERKRQESAQ